jgi:hypothetical protein
MKSSMQDCLESWRVVSTTITFETGNSVSRRLNGSKVQESASIEFARLHLKSASPFWCSSTTTSTTGTSRRRSPTSSSAGNITKSGRTARWTSSSQTETAILRRLTAKSSSKSGPGEEPRLSLCVNIILDVECLCLLCWECWSPLQPCGWWSFYFILSPFGTCVSREVDFRAKAVLVGNDSARRTGVSRTEGWYDFTG